MRGAKSKPFYVGVDVGGTKILTGVFDASLKLLGAVKMKTRAEEGAEAVLDRIESSVREVVAEQGLRMADVRAVGLGVPGVVRRGRVVCATNLGWTDLPIIQIMKRRLRRPVFADNDCNLFALGVHTVEFKGRPRHLLGVFLGTGIGGGIIIDGKLHVGFTQGAGEFGLLILDRTRPKTGFGIRGTFETLASRKGMHWRLCQEIAKGGKTVLTTELGRRLQGLRSRHLLQAWDDRDALVRRVVREVAQDVGLAVASLISAFGPEYVVLGGGVMEALKEPMLPIIRKTAAQHVLPGTLTGVKIVTSKMGDAGGITGAAVWARSQVSA
ncbi:MAG: ROK family protein [Pedosphaera sp.]|nr:ROK family protein [Pedosphaera sp.]MSU44228.1 ROK family protein [Pedosphaera sp.]